MPRKKQKSVFSSEDWSFVQMATKIGMLNPFSAERAQLDKELAGLTGGESKLDRLAMMRGMVLGRLLELEANGTYHLGRYEGEERKTLLLMLLVDVFLRFKDPCLELIKAQKESEISLPVPFAGELLGYLVEHGASEAEAIELLEYTYQVRRAYHFIDESLIGRSVSMIALREALWDNVFTHQIWWYRQLRHRLDDFSTLFLGETGTGKGAAAQAVGLSSFIRYDADSGCFVTPFHKQFLSLNLSEFPEGLIESELFGHQKGAFTGALQTQEGILHKSRPFGVIFLDELGDLSLHLQVKLLQVIQQRIFSPVGSREVHQLHGRIFGATNRPIDDLLSQGLFREDFYYRLCTHEIQLPTLRQRIAELPSELEELVGFIIERIMGQADGAMEAFVLDRFQEELGPDYPWPGNVRELEQYTRRILLTGSCKAAGRSQRRREPALVEKLQAGIAQQRYKAKDLLRDYCQLLFQEHQNYNEVARQVGLDRRTVKKYIDES